MFLNRIASLSAFVILWLSAFISGSDAALGGSPAQDQKTVFSNRDIEKYRYPSDLSERQQADSRKEGKKDGIRKREEQQDKEYWCRKATHYRKKLEKAQEEVRKQEERLEELKDSASQELGGKRKALEKEVKNTQKKLRTARKGVEDGRRDMDRLEDEAHRKGVPPGWLRCQYTW